MNRSSARPGSKLAKGVASCVMLLPGGCRRTPAEVGTVEPGPAELTVGDPQACTPCAAARPAPGSSGDREPPTVLGARFVARDRVQLSFSEALAPTETVNPRQFRISRAYSMISPDTGYASGYYYDLGGADPYQPPLVVLSLELYEDRPEVLALNLSRPVPVEVCEEITDLRAQFELMANEGASERGRTGLFLHYTSRGSEGVRDRADNPLEEFGGEWALHFGARHRESYGADPVMRLDLLPELPCPPDTMPLGGSSGPS